MSINRWKDFTNKGFVFASYTFLRMFDMITAVVLCQLIAEYNHAFNNNLHIEKNFLINTMRLCDYLGISQEELQEAFKELEEEEFFFTRPTGINNTLLGSIELQNIINFKQEIENAKNLQSWDWGLINTQKPQWQTAEFKTSTFAIINFVEKNLKNPETIPTVVYVYCDFLIQQYEMNGKIFADITNLGDKLLETLTKQTFKPIDIAILIQELCYMEE